jgi:hypothetical protein
MPALAELLSCVQVLKYSICALSTSATKVTHSMKGHYSRVHVPFFTISELAYFTVHK